MSFIDTTNFEDSQELKSVPEGEYQVRVLSAEVKASQKTGGDYIMARLDIPSEPLSKEMNHVMMLPTNSDTEKQRNNRSLAIKNFFKAFGFSGKVNLPEMEGATAWAILREEEDEEYGMQNRVRRFVLPK